MVQDSPDPELTTGFIKKERFKSNDKCRDGVCLPSPEWELVPQERSLGAEGSTSQSTGTDSWNHNWACVLEAKGSIWFIQGYELYDIWRGLIVKDKVLYR